MLKFSLALKFAKILLFGADSKFFKIKQVALSSFRYIREEGKSGQHMAFRLLTGGFRAIVTESVTENIPLFGTETI